MRGDKLAPAFLENKEGDTVESFTMFKANAAHVACNALLIHLLIILLPLGVRHEYHVEVL